MKNKLLVVSFMAALAITSCSKEADDITTTNTSTTTKSSNTVFGKNDESKDAKLVTVAYSDYFNATSTITPTATGVFNPGSGVGHATRMGEARNCFNQIVNFIGSQPVGSSAAPVSQFFSTTLAKAGIYYLPSAVSSITYDDDGNSVWFTSSTGTSLAPVSATRVNFSASLVIIGGTGKFKGAIGSATMSGYFNPQTANQAAVMQTSGMITYKNRDRD